MAIYLIRHGWTAANEKHLYCGATDLPLSERGVSGVEELKGQGVYPTCVDLRFTSGMTRTEQTLDIICGQTGRTAIPELAEYNFGDFEMQGYDQLKVRGDYQAWIADQTGLIACPGGESRQRFERRVLAGFGQLLEKSKGARSVLAVCHGGTIATIMESLNPGQRNFYEWRPSPGRGYMLVYEGGELCQYKEV